MRECPRHARSAYHPAKRILLRSDNTEKELCDYCKRRMVIFSAARKVICCAMRSVILRLRRSDMIFAPKRAKRISPGEAGYHCEAITLAAGEYH